MSRTELLQKARVTRQEASRAKRLARQLTQDADRSRLLRYAEDLEHQADDLERDARDDGKGDDDRKGGHTPAAH